MIDIKQIREHPENYKNAAMRKRIEVDIELILDLDRISRQILAETEQLRAIRNKNAARTLQFQDEELEAHLIEAKAIATQLDAKERELREIRTKLNMELLRVPSIPSADTPDGADDNDNLEIRKFGAPSVQNFAILDHLELAQMHKLADFENTRKFAGSRAYALTGAGALLEMALMRFAVDNLLTKGFQLVVPPVMVREAAMTGTGYFPLGAENAYHLDDQLYLVGTAEVPLVALKANTTFAMGDLPLKMAGISTCFRREAGAAGKDTKGLYRVHQFQKVEQVVIASNDPMQTERLHYELLQNAEELLQALELPYRIVAVCTGDLGQGQVRKHDIETWMPSRNAYGETHSCSTMNEFQARRMGIKFIDENGKKQFAHTLNNTAIASPRILIPILENHQQNDGNVYIPKALRPYLGGKELLV